MKKSQPLDLAVIGNCRIAAMIDCNARIVWWCFPRLDGDPVFSRLVSGREEKGFADVILEGCVNTRSAYVRNTAVLETFMEDARGGSIRITDFVPRFGRYERIFRPPQIVRRIDRLSGMPRITIRIRPTFEYGKQPTQVVLGSNHIRYVGSADVVRLSTNAPLTYITNEVTFAPKESLTLLFGADEPFLSDIDTTARDFEHRTRAYWLDWSRSLAVPFEWQTHVIRSAITLKLCSFEETGAIVAALTTSIPEAPGTSRNWDYRFCWLRDAFFVVDALNRLGATQTMESYINYLTTVVADSDTPLAPLHGIVPGTALQERVTEHLDGFLGYGPVRVGNAASIQAQHDIYGSIILGTQQMFIDQRLPMMGDVSLFQRLEQLGEQAARLAFVPDAGIWEYRGRSRVHTYSAALCWAACERLAQIATALGLDDRSQYWTQVADGMREKIIAKAWNEKIGALVGAFDYPDLDASVLMVAELGLISATDPKFVSTCKVIGRDLGRNGRIMRYTAEDDFGAPETAFLACNFWYIDALAATGQREHARELFCDLLTHTNAFGILSEDLHPVDGTLWGNIPQTYSMAGIINSAMRLSKPWEDAWCRAS